MNSLLDAPARPWAALLSDSDRATLAHGGFGRRTGFGRRPAVLVIDAQNYMVGEVGSDADWPASCGEAGRAALGHIDQLVQAAQRHGVPCFFTLFELERDGSDAGVYARKREPLTSEHWCLRGSLGARMVPQLRPGPGDMVIVKKKPSGFHGTPLLGHLVHRGIDTVVIVGGSTSNCVRATALDAASHNFRVAVPHEAVFDRIPLSHAVSLFDMDRQSGDVVAVQDVLCYFHNLAASGGGA